MAGRVIVLVAALLVAVLGAVLVYLYAERTVERAEAPLELVDVLVASEEIPEGTSITEAVTAGLLETQPRPTNALPQGYLTGIDDVQGWLTRAPLLRNEILSLDRLQDPEDSDGLRIQEQDMAITIPLDDPNRVGGFVEPLDLVAVFLTRQSVPVDEEGVTGSPVATTDLLLPEVRVIGIGSQTDPDVEQADDVSPSLVTVSVPQRDAQRLIHAQTLGTLYLAKLTDQSVVARSGGTTSGTLFEDAP